MKDAEFKKLNHHSNCFTKYSDGKQIVKNYSPDYVLSNNNNFIILEHESEPNRKTIVANVIKAAHFLNNEKTGILVIVITPKRKSSLESYPKHVQPYLNWIKDISNLQEVYFILEHNYYFNGNLIKINSKQFNTVSIKIDNRV